MLKESAPSDGCSTSEVASGEKGIRDRCCRDGYNARVQRLRKLREILRSPRERNRLPRGWTRCPARCHRTTELFVGRRKRFQQKWQTENCRKGSGETLPSPSPENRR